MDELGKKLDILIKLQAASLTAKFETVKDKVIFLSNVGLSPSLIAEIVGKTANQVNVTLSKHRSSKKEG